MSRTIRRKGWHVTTSCKWHDQKNNLFAYIKDYGSTDPVRFAQYVEREIKENMERPAELEALMKERHRDAFWKTLRWKKYAEPIPRIFSRMEIKCSIKYDEDYVWNEKGARQMQKGICSMLWD